MNAPEIKSKCHWIEGLASAKGYYAPKVTVYINWIGYDLTVSVEYRTEASASTKNHFVHVSCEEGLEAAFEMAVSHVSNLPSIEDAKRNEFIAAVGRLIDKGRDIGIQVDFLNPLNEMMTKLSSNIITKQ